MPLLISSLLLPVFVILRDFCTRLRQKTGFMLGDIVVTGHDETLDGHG